MTRLIVARLGAAALTLLIVSVAVFIATEMLPGDVAEAVLGQSATPEAVAPPMPVISGLSPEELASMRTAPGPKARAAIGVIRALLRSGTGLTAEISEIDMSRREGPVLYTVDGVEVRLGSEDWDERLARLEGVLTQIATQDVRTVDLRFRDQVVFQRAGTR